MYVCANKQALSVLLLNSKNIKIVTSVSDNKPLSANLQIDSSLAEDGL